VQKNPIAFFSYVHLNDHQDDGRLTELRKRLEREVEVQTGAPFPIFQDRNDIKWGQLWKERIEGGIDGSTFLIAVVTPSYLNSEACRDEFNRFLEREKKLKRNDLILPLLYVSTPTVTDEKKRNGDSVAEQIGKRQWANWSDLRHEPWASADVGKRLASIATQIRDAIERDAEKQKGKPKLKKKPRKVSIGSDGGAVEQPEIGAAKAENTRAAIRNEPKTWVIDPFPNRGDFQTISAAIQNASAGQRILIRPGLYREGIILEKPLEIIGDGRLEDIVVEAVGSSALVSKTDFGRIANITFRQAGGGKYFAVDIGQGRLELNGCDITSDSQACIGVYGGADPRILRNRIHDGKRSGVNVHKNGKGTFEDNDIFGNAFAGVQVKQDSNPIFRRNRIHDSRQCGVMCFENGKGTFEENDIFENALSGVELKTDSDPVFRRNRIHHGKQNGVLVHTNGNGTFEVNDIFRNANDGFRIQTGGEPAVRANKITANQGHAIRVLENGGGVFEDNVLSGNTKGAWNIHESSKAKVKSNGNIE